MRAKRDHLGHVIQSKWKYWGQAQCILENRRACYKVCHLFFSFLLWAIWCSSASCWSYLYTFPNSVVSDTHHNLSEFIQSSSAEKWTVYSFFPFNSWWRIKNSWKMVNLSPWGRLRQYQKAVLCELHSLLRSKQRGSTCSLLLPHIQWEPGTGSQVLNPTALPGSRVVCKGRQGVAHSLARQRQHWSCWMRISPQTPQWVKT